MSQDASRQVIKAPDVLLQDLEGDAVLLNLANGQYYGLDENSHHMYKALTAADSIEAAFQSLLRDYEIEPARLRADLQNFIEHLLENGLLVYADGKTE